MEQWEYAVVICRMEGRRAADSPSYFVATCHYSHRTSEQREYGPLGQESTQRDAWWQGMMAALRQMGDEGWELLDIPEIRQADNRLWFKRRLAR